MTRRLLSMARTALWILLLAGLLTSPAAARWPTQGYGGASGAQLSYGTPPTFVRTLTVDGISRTYNVYMPAGASGALPVVLAFHPAYATPAGLAAITFLPAVGAHYGFIAVLPAGYDRSWNVGDGCCGLAGSQNINDLDFVDAILTDLDNFANVDHARIYATGYSNGGGLVFALACERANKFAAVAPVSAPFYWPMSSCTPSRPVPMMQWQGGADPAVPINGGQGTGPTAPPVPSLASVEAFWVGVNGDTSTSTPSLYDASCTYNYGGTGTAPYEACVIPFMGHRWPGCPDTPALDAFDAKLVPVLGDLGAFAPNTPGSDLIWLFLSSYHL